MNSNTNRPTVFSLCGLDGVGKTSIFSALSQQLNGGDFGFVGRGPNDAEMEVESLFPRKYKDYRDWIEGDYANAMSFACAIDYCAYYRSVIQTLIDGASTERLGMPIQAVITDRHAACFKAYANAISPVDSMALTLLDQIPQPDVIIYIELSQDEIEKRQGKDKHEFEDSQIQRLVRGGYELVLSEYEGTLIRVDNSGTLADSVARIKSEIKKVLESNKENVL
jgi:thymidylate kinase